MHVFSLPFNYNALSVQLQIVISSVTRMLFFTLSNFTMGLTTTRYEKVIASLWMTLSLDCYGKEIWRLNHLSTLIKTSFHICKGCLAREILFGRIMTAGYF